MRSAAALALICLNAACWTTVAAAEDAAQGTAGKPGNIMATAPRQVDTTHGLVTISGRDGAAAVPVPRGTAAGASSRAVQPASLNATAGAVQPASLTATAGIARSATVSPSAATAESGGSLATARPAPDRTGTVFSLASAPAAAPQPMGLNAAAGNAASRGGAAATKGIQLASTAAGAVGAIVNAVGVAGWKTGIAQGPDAAGVRATALSDPAGAGNLKPKQDAGPTRSVGLWNSATSMNSAVQRIKPIGHKK